MSINDNAVFTAGTGYIFTAEPGTPMITPEQLAAFDPETFGTNAHKVVPAAAAFTITVGAATSESIAAKATAAEVQAALEKVTSVGAGNVVVKGDATKGFVIHFVGTLAGKDLKVTASGSATATEVAKSNGWVQEGHTSREDLPEIGYEGGDSEVKGTWQKKNLRTVETDPPVDYVTMKLHQFDMDVMEKYYGKNDSKVANVFGKDNPGTGTVEKALMMVIVDGSFSLAFGAAKASFTRDEAVSLSTDDMSVLPLKATFLKHPGRHLFEWIFPAR